MNPATAHKELVTKHTTMAHFTQNGRIAARKQDGVYIVTIENFETKHVSRMQFKTLRGALIAFDEARGLI